MTTVKSFDDRKTEVNKMKKRTKLISLTLIAAMLLGSCSAPAQTTSAAPAPAAETTTSAPETTTTAAAEVPDDGSVYADLSGGMPANFEASDGWTNGDPFNVTWYAGNVTFNDGRMQLIIDNDPAPKKGIPYSGGEFRSKDFYGYGRYEVSMKAISNDGVVSSFFTYTGPSDNNPWDEIDVEILGKDTTQVQFNYYLDGRGGHEYMHDLGFDASEDFHTYAFEWREKSITWFVDGEEVYKVEKEDSSKIPSTPGKIMMNAWCGKGVDGWLKAFTDEKLPLTAEYEWLRYTPFDE